MEKVYIYDSTLRDGSQGEGVSLTVEDKLKIALKLDQLGVDYIEGGWPGSNPKDLEFFRRIGGLKLEHARVAAFGSTRKPGISAGNDTNLRSLVQAGVSTVTIFGKSWDFHVREVLQTTMAENLNMIGDSIRYLKSHGLEVIYDAEHFFDGFKNNREYALATLAAAQEAGADWIVLCDTNGGLLPTEVSPVMEAVRRVVTVPLGIHAHNDGDLAVANTLLAVQAGARQVQGCMNGFGERCGNANLCSVIPNLELKLGFRCLPEGKLKILTEASRYISEVANVVQQHGQPFVGLSAFAHKGGVHVHAVLKAPHSYEHISPESVGNSRRVLISELGGMSNLLYKAREMNLDLDFNREKTRELVEKIKQLEFEGYQFEGAEASLELLFRRALGDNDELFSLETFRVLVEQHASQEVTSEATVKLRVKDTVVHTAGEGNGPVNALDNALRKALESYYPELKEIHLTDYKVRVLDEKDGTAAKVRVLIESRDGTSAWSTVGVSTNMIEASWQALVDSLEYGLRKKLEKRACRTG